MYKYVCFCHIKEPQALYFIFTKKKNFLIIRPSIHQKLTGGPCEFLLATHSFSTVTHHFSNQSSQSTTVRRLKEQLGAIFPPLLSMSQQQHQQLPLSLLLFIIVTINSGNHSSLPLLLLLPLLLFL